MQIASVDYKSLDEVPTGHSMPFGKPKKLARGLPPDLPYYGSTSIVHKQQRWMLSLLSAPYNDPIFTHREIEH